MYKDYNNVERVKPSGLELKDHLVGVQRVTKVTKGGRTFSFSAIVVVGNEDGIVGHGLGKANEVTTAIAKGDRQSTMLDMATQLGISAWQPLQCDRSVSRVGKNSYQRWQRICLEACKQSGSAWLPDLLPMVKPEEVASNACAEGREVLLAHPDGAALDVSSDTDKLLMIGPEGGFTEDEVRRIVAAGATTFSLGHHILRIETAAVSLLARFRLA